ncbi:carboxylating nicotinate-nucleotide diphosphorylase [Candidatus Anaplasma sp. TIGMIC]|uniref:carboxylating nicotinate-nucleotide diphosphorylase n=1 Tax=Candidatus Anaplasma sp. TIGMIC TaxID=3020713 RepID=UPI00232D4F61|nr:carboxylating nicotinate-nucleotide diphosphorylase [Candidatus Anaplasma sp. TIGMIC]MDB1135479.1 carboxylating nicotinate-nucleotide diphosphorylase [Candidatus Anaplasma sp. TIGMIC]
MFESIIYTALEEDLGQIGDITTSCIVGDEKIKFNINTREEMVVSGMRLVSDFSGLFPQDDIILTPLQPDGALVTPGTCIIEGSGRATKVLSVERVLLNFLQRASGISSLTKQFVDAVSGTKTTIRSTRKTCPGLRQFDLYAVKVGGGSSFRMGLFDGIMIKDNHIASCSGISECVKRVRDKFGPTAIISVECDTTDQVIESVENMVDTVLLDNMSIYDIKRSVSIVSSLAKIEVSGGVTLHNVRDIAACCVDYISIGCITNSVMCKDIGLDVTERYS